jgi:hypothetical protein
MNDDQPLETLEPLEFLRRQRLDVVALLWMVSTVAIVGVQIYGAFNFLDGRFPGFGTWEKVAALAQTGGPIVALSCLAGIALAAMFDTTAARAGGGIDRVRGIDAPDLAALRQPAAVNVALTSHSRAAAASSSAASDGLATRHL